MVKAPFVVTMETETACRVWGYGLGYLPMNIIAWGYNVRGGYIGLPFVAMWRWVHGRGYQISNGQ